MNENVSMQRFNAVMRELKAIRDLVEAQRSVNEMLEEFRSELKEALRLKEEFDQITDAISQTKQEIATLHYAGTQGREMAKVTDELGAIVLATEQATNQILAASERIDEIAGNLVARLAGDDKALASEISDKVISIFEACNFQDITGQRVSKVVNAMRFIEERVKTMIEIWGGLERFQDVLAKIPERHGEKALLNGPALAGEGLADQDLVDTIFNAGDELATDLGGQASQADIDALFA